MSELVATGGCAKSKGISKKGIVIMRTATCISGLTLLAAGIFCIMNSGQLFIALAFIAGCGLLASGILEAAARFIPGPPRRISILLPVEGAVSFLMGIAVLGNRLIDESTVVTIFGVWVMFSGILRIAAALEIKEETLRFRGALLILGSVSVAVGFYGFFYPLYFDLTAIVLTGCYFTLQGINAAAVGIGVTRVPTAPAAPLTER
jgi:uncharacterized membrane protein HdeD (DUF308 family)